MQHQIAPRAASKDRWCALPQVHKITALRARRRYKKNEVFLDVVESVNLLVNSNGTVVRSEVMGALKMRTFLSGMPECKLGLNDKVRG